MKCFDYHKKNNSICENKACRYWLNFKKNKNCCIISSKSEDKFTLEDIGKLFKVTRMRICQIEKQAIKKIRELVL